LKNNYLRLFILLCSFYLDAKGTNPEYSGQGCKLKSTRYLYMPSVAGWSPCLHVWALPDGW